MGFQFTDAYLGSGDTSSPSSVHLSEYHWIAWFSDFQQSIHYLAERTRLASKVIRTSIYAFMKCVR